MGKGSSGTCGRPALALGSASTSARPTAFRWTDELLREELGRFLAGRSSWPSQREFLEAGRRHLLKAVYKRGGPHRWAAEFGMTARGLGDDRIWTEQRIEAELRRLVDELGRWPEHADFRAAGLRPTLYLAMQRYGGLKLWRRRAVRSGWITRRGRAVNAAASSA